MFHLDYSDPTPAIMRPVLPPSSSELETRSVAINRPNSIFASGSNQVNKFGPVAHCHGMRIRNLLNLGVADRIGHVLLKSGFQGKLND